MKKRLESITWSGRYAILIQSFVRAVICRRYFSIIRSVLSSRQKIESLIDTPGLTNDLVYRIDYVKMWPPLIILYKYTTADTSSSREHSTKWCTIDRDRFATFMSQELSRTIQLAKVKKTQTTTRRSTKKDLQQLKREQIRKKSQLKWKWFYERNSDSPVDNQGESSCSEIHSLFPTPRSQKNEEETEEDVMVWLTKLDLNEEEE